MCARTSQFLADALVGNGYDSLEDLMDVSQKDLVGTLSHCVVVVATNGRQPFAAGAVVPASRGLLTMVTINIRAG